MVINDSEIMLLSRTYLIIVYLIDLDIFPFLGTGSNKTDFPLYGVSLIFVLWKLDVYCGNQLFSPLRLTFCNGYLMLQV
jgi:hypothetical protein